MSNRAWMPLHITDYLADTGHLTAAEHGAYMLLIMHYWQNGSLPDNERLIARIARLDATQWEESRDVLAMLFGDGWTHKRIDAELAKADEIIEKRRAAADASHKKRKCNANAEHMQSKCGDTGALPSTNNQSSSLRSEDAARGRLPAAPVDNWPDNFRERFWAKYPHKVGKPDAIRKLEAARKRGVAFTAIMDGLRRYVETKPPDRPWCNPATWLNQERWADEPAAVSPIPKTNGARDVPASLSSHARNLGDRIAAAQRGEPLFAIGGDEGGGNPVRMLPDGRFGGT